MLRIHSFVHEKGGGGYYLPGHWVLVTGIDPVEQRIIFRDPNDGPLREMTYSRKADGTLALDAPYLEYMRKGVAELFSPGGIAIDLRSAAPRRSFSRWDLSKHLYLLLTDPGPKVATNFLRGMLTHPVKDKFWFAGIEVKQQDMLTELGNLLRQADFPPKVKASIEPLFESVRKEAAGALGLETSRLVIAPVRPEEFNAMTKMILDPKAMKLSRQDFDERQVRQMLANGQTAATNAHEAGLVNFAVHDKAGKLVGVVYLYHPHNAIRWKPGQPFPLEVGFSLDSKEWGKGYATEAAEAVIRFALDKLKADGIVARTRLGNEPSRRVLEKLGFKEEEEKFGMKNFRLSLEEFRRARPAK